MASLDAAPSHRLRNLAVVVVLIAIVVVGYAWLRGPAPTITAPDLPAAVGAQKMLTFDIHDPAGVASVEVAIEQNGKSILLGRQTLASRQWFTTGNAPPVVHFSVQAGKAAHPELADGAAQLVVTARAANLRAATATLTRSMSIESKPPSAYAMSSQIYLNQGGSAVVVYHVSKNAAGDGASGVEMGGVFFPGYPLPNAPPAANGATMFALFAFPYNAPADSQPHLIATDAAGNQVTASLPVRTFPKKFRSRTLPIDDAFIQRVVMPIIANTPGLTDQGDPEKNFLLVNRTLRRTDTQELIDAAKLTEPKFLWNGAFLQLGRATVEAVFADHRSYQYHGQIIDQEDHLGYDLAAVRHTPVKAANSGKVIWTKYFGIYGNCVLIDHGYGLMSLYAHLNDFVVKPGDTVTAGQLIAHSDSTGLAGGDHLHFSMLLDGVQVNPLEWWDPHWVQVSIQAPLAQFVPAPTPPAPAPAK